MRVGVSREDLLYQRRGAPKLPARTLLRFRAVFGMGKFIHAHEETYCCRGITYPNFYVNCNDTVIGYINPYCDAPCSHVLCLSHSAWILQHKAKCSQDPWKKILFGNLIQAFTLLHRMRVVHAAPCARGLTHSVMTKVCLSHAWITQRISAA